LRPVFFQKSMSICPWLVRRLNERDSSARLSCRRLAFRRSYPMRFMYIVTPVHKGPPTPALAEAMHKLADREIKAGRMLDSGGLMPVSMGAQVRITDGRLNVVDGPFVETKELIGGYAIFELRDKEEAVAAAVEFMQLHKE